MKAAIEILKTALKAFGEGTYISIFSEGDDKQKIVKELPIAIRVLEAAGKVDKTSLLVSFVNICAEARVSGRDVDAIRSLLEALPDSDSIIVKIRTLDPFRGNAADDAIDRLENDLIDGSLPEKEE